MAELISLLPILTGAVLTVAASYALGRLALRALELPRTVVYGAGSALLSLVVFVLLLAGVAYRYTLLGLCILLVAGAGWVRWRENGGQTTLSARQTAAWDRVSLSPFSQPLIFVVLAFYGVLYAVYALAPEIQPDAITYHLGLASTYVRLGGFAPRVSFYEVLPHGLELLFTVAFAMGKHSAAKLVHFSFLIGTVPLMLTIGRRLGLSETASYSAAAIYVITPVVGVSGTSAYNDAALVFFLLATFVVLLLWRDKGDDRYLLVAGVLAGFCYTIKMTGLIGCAAAALYVLSRRRFKGLLLLCAGALLVIAPWMIRSAVLTGNPVAPFFNHYFPNAYFHQTTEQRLLDALRNYGGVTLAHAPMELTVRGRLLHGLLGPLFLLAPLGLLALRRRAGWLPAAVAALMAAPWLTNMGARFLMPSLPWIALLMMTVLPRPLILACVLFHAVASWPHVIAQYEDVKAWRLEGFPWKAALRIEPEKEYLHRNSPSYRVAEMVQANTLPGVRILDFAMAPNAYVTRELVGYWQSATADRLAEGLDLATREEHGVLSRAESSWPERELRALRFERGTGSPEVWSIQEVNLWRGQSQVEPFPGWLIDAWPNPWEAALAFDRNVITRWSSREPGSRGMYVEVNFPRPQRLTGATVVLASPAQQAGMEIYGQEEGGRWRLLSANALPAALPLLNLRPAATRAVLREGIRYILVHVSREGYGLTGRDMTEHARDWGLELAGTVEDVNLFRIQ